MSDPAAQSVETQGFDWANLVPLFGIIAKLTGTTADDKVVQVAGGILSNPYGLKAVEGLIGLFGNLIHHHAASTAPAPGTHPVPVNTPVILAALAPAAPPPPPAAPATSPGTFDEVASLKGHLGMIELPERLTGGQRGVEDLPRRAEILAGANAYSDSRFHADCSPMLADGTEITTGDPRWASANRWAPNGCPIWLYYEWNGLSTLDGHQSENVNPGSVEDDQGCTPTYLVHGPGKFRFGFQYRKHDGTVIDSGLIGQGNVAGGEPFNISQG